MTVLSKYFPLFLLYIICLPVAGDDIYSVYFDSRGNPRCGEWVLSVSEADNPSVSLGSYLGMEDQTVRRKGAVSYISSRAGDGYIPILAFHKLGEAERFELKRELFEELLVYLNINGFHVISDYQYLTGDYTFAVNGKKIIVLGADDASAGAFYYKTDGDLKTGNFIMEKGQYIISDESMVYYLNKYLPIEEGRRNFTFYITFDAIPFRQTGNGLNTGAPYYSMFAPLSKFQYLQKNYHLGNHTANHFYSEDLDELDFIDELIEFYDIMESYGMDLASIKTLAYSFGIGKLSAEREHTVKTFSYKDVRLAGAFDYNGYLTYPVDHKSVNIFDVSRIGVDNRSYRKLLDLLESVDIFVSRRAVLVESDEYPFDLRRLKMNKSDLNYILIRN